MRTKRKNSILLVIRNLISTVLFLLPVKELDLFNENYSTLSLTTRGYLCLLFIGIIIGSLLSIETSMIKNKKNGLLMFASILIGVIIPHHVPYDFQGNIHLLFAYIGFAGLVSLTIINCSNSKDRDIYLLLIFLSILIYLKYGMVNTLSEIIVMISSLFFNLYNVLKKKI